MLNPVPKSQRDVLRGLSRLTLRMPASTRELFQLLAMHDTSQGLAGLLDRVDFAGVTASQIDRLVHGRAPEIPVQTRPEADFDARVQLEAALRSAEFQSNIVRTLLASFPEKRREVFIHIPKCAGTELILNLAPQRLSVPQVLGVEGWIPKDEFLQAVIEIAKAIRFRDDVFVFGHFELSQYINFAGVRPGDTFFTIIRDPFDQILSQANFSVSRLCKDPEGNDPDSRAILDILNLPRLPEQPSHGLLKELTARCLLNPRIAQPNRTCYHLGHPGDRGYRAAMANLVAYDFEITTTQRYSRWLRERWSIASDTQHNRSTTFLTKREAKRLFSEILAERIAEDQRFYDVVDGALQQSRAASITGTELARLVGGGLLEDMPAGAAAELRDGRSGAEGLVIAARSATPCARYLQPVSADLLPPPQRQREALTIDFGRDGNSRSYVGDGWSRPEAEFTWTSGSRAQLHLPRPAPPDAYLLRMFMTPFREKERHPAQRLDVAVNGRQMGSVTVQDMVVVECELPWSLLASSESIDLVLTLPDAVQASSVKDVQDSRVLAFAVRQVALIGTGAGVGADAEVAAVAAHAPADAAVGRLFSLFESLGENCEFGLVQRRAGIEPLGLLRFSSTPLPPLLGALRARFAGMGLPETIEVEIAASGREYMIFDRKFGFRYHAWVKLGEMEPEAIHARETRRLPFLIRKLVEGLTEGEKIFVFHGMTPLTDAQAHDLAAAIHAFGPATLLWVEHADEAHPPGTVIRIAPGLLKGHMDRFAPGENAHDLSLDCWVTLCRNAHALVHARQAA